jgi:hypothetical protein
MESLLDRLKSDGRFRDWIRVRWNVSWLDCSHMEGLMYGLESDGKFSSWIGVRWKVL